MVRQDRHNDIHARAALSLAGDGHGSAEWYIELGTSSEALGHLGYMDMLNRFFKNDLNNSAAGRMRGEVIKSGASRAMLKSLSGAGLHRGHARCASRLTWALTIRALNCRPGSSVSMVSAETLPKECV